jgi:uncharacterized protein (DUF2147 family)
MPKDIFFKGPMGFYLAIRIFIFLKFIFMRTIFFSVLSMITAVLFAKSPEPNVLGTWLVGDKDYKVELYKSGDQLEGKLVWLEEPNDNKTGKPRTDVENPDPAMRSRPVMGLKILWDFKWNPETGYYESGKVYKKGKTYCGKLKLQADGTVYLTGYLCSMTIFKKSDTWTRVK